MFNEAKIWTNDAMKKNISKEKRSDENNMKRAT